MSLWGNFRSTLGSHRGYFRVNFGVTKISLMGFIGTLYGDFKEKILEEH